MGVRKGVLRSVEREAYWRVHVEAQRGSGELIRAYCACRGLRESSFHYWKRELRRRDGEAAGHEGERAGKGRGDSAELFAELAVSVPAPAGSIEILLPGSRRVSVHPGFDEATLCRVLAVLE